MDRSYDNLVDNDVKKAESGAAEKLTAGEAAEELTATEKLIAETASAKDEVQIRPASTPLPRTYVPVVRKRRWGDRRDGRRLHNITGMTKMMPFIMKNRSDGCNTYADEFDVTECDAFCKKMIRAGYKNFSFLHVMFAAYVRTVSQRPGINRFVSGQRVYSRNSIQVNMVIKKEMKLSSPDTAVKVEFQPDDTIEEIYEKFNAIVEANKNSSELDSDFDGVVGKLASLPRPILRTIVRLLFWLDYHGWIPKSLLDVSPFHGSMIITSMGSLGIRPIYHHIYDFGNLPIFLAYGIKLRRTHTGPDGKPVTRKYIEVKAVTDERICDGYYYASAFKYMRSLVEHPEALLRRPEKVYEDVD